MQTCYLWYVCHCFCAADTCVLHPAQHREHVAVHAGRPRFRGVHFADDGDRRLNHDGGRWGAQGVTGEQVRDAAMVAHVCQFHLMETEMFFYLTTHSTHFIIYGYIASYIWLRTILIVRKERKRERNVLFNDALYPF